MSGLAFTREEFEARLNRTRAGLAERGLDVGVFFAAESVCYLSGYGTPSHYGFQHLVVPQEGAPFFATRKQMLEGFLRSSWMEEHIAFADGADPVSVSCDALRDRGFAAARIGLEEAAPPLTVRTWRAFQEGMPDASFADCSGIVEQLRLVKSPAEIDHIRRAANIADIGMAAAREVIRAGVSERVIAAEVLHKATLAGGEHTAVPLLVGMGDRAALAMPVPTDRKLRPGEVLWVEVFGTTSHYAAGLKAIFGAGPSAKDAERRLETAVAALERAIAAAAPGRPASVIPEAIQSTFREAGYSDSSYHQSGYSMGVTIAPAPHEARMLSLRLDNKMELREGMTLHPIANLYGPDPWPAVAASHMIVITKTGAEVLTRFMHSTANLSL